MQSFLRRLYYHHPRLFAENHLRVVEPVHYGSWSGRDEFVSFQNIVIATKY